LHLVYTPGGIAVNTFADVSRKAYNTDMDELVPFQEKRKKQFPADFSILQAISSELEKHVKKAYPTFEFGTGTVATDITATVFGKQVIMGQVSLEVLATALAPVVSPVAMKTDTAFSLATLEVPMLILSQLSIALTVKRAYLVLPKPYQKAIKRTYISITTLKKLSAFLESNKKAKKYLRIMHKRLGIYTKKKPPLNKTS